MNNFIEEALQRPHKTQEEILKVIDEISRYNSESGNHWEIRHISHLYLMSEEVYVVTYANQLSETFCREPWADGKLVQASGWSYHATYGFEDHHAKDDEFVKKLLQEGGGLNP